MATLGPKAQATLVCFLRLPPDIHGKISGRSLQKTKKSFVVKNVLQVFHLKKCLPLAEDKFQPVRCPPTTLQKNPSYENPPELNTI
jgi:hypothetical protein